jgi:glutamyl-Q tRNA(Asp) synthetase
MNRHGAKFSTYIGRFAPSPTGVLHAGSLVAALASYLDARQHHGQWLIRIEDVDTSRCQSNWADAILQQLTAFGLQSDQSVLWQTQRNAHYQKALDHLIEKGWAYPCGCSRKEITDAQTAAGIERQRHQASVYPGTCRTGLKGQAARAWRLNVQQVMRDLNLQEPMAWNDRRLGAQTQNVAAEVGDFILKRADGLWAYQLAVVVDDAAQGITHVVRGEDLADNTARQIVLQKALGASTPLYWHTPLVCATDGEKLSKQNGAQALDTSCAAFISQNLNNAASVLGLPAISAPAAQQLRLWTQMIRADAAPLGQALLTNA